MDEVYEHHFKRDREERKEEEEEIQHDNEEKLA